MGSPESITYHFWRFSLSNFMCCQSDDKEQFSPPKVAKVFLDELKNQTQSSLGLNVLKVAPLILSFLCSVTAIAKVQYVVHSMYNKTRFDF